MERSLEELERAIADGKFLSWASDYLVTWGSNYSASHEFSHPFDDFGGHFSILNHADPTVLAGLLLGIPLLLLAVGKHMIGYDDEPDNYYGYDSHPQYYNDEILKGAYKAEENYDNYNTNNDKKGFLHNKFDNIVNQQETIFNLNLLNRIVSHMKNRMKIFPTAEEEKKSYYNSYNTHHTNGHDPYDHTNMYDIHGNKQHPYEPPNTYNVDQNINHYEDPPNSYNMNKPYSYEAPNAYNINENIHHYEEPPNTYNMKGNAHQYGDPNEYNVNENKNSYDDRNTYNKNDNKRYTYQDVYTYNRNRNPHHEDLNTYNRNKNTHHEDPHYTRRKPQQHRYDDQNGYMESMGIEYNLYEVENGQKEPYKGQKDYIHGFMDEPKSPNKDFFSPDEDFYGIKETEPVKKVKHTKVPKTPTSYNRSQRKGLNRPTSKLAKTVSTQIQMGNNANQS